MQKATFAAGCFWGVQAYFDKLEGVSKTAVGYTGGRTENPTYEKVCSRSTGHAEAIEIEFDEKKISYRQLLSHFFKMHDPTQKNRQGPDAGDNYRSAIFYHGASQKKQAEEMIKELNASKKYSKQIATTLEKASVFWKAEGYHQKYYKKHNVSCHI
ncbi:peptide-methionine (S)-S-oxide reductase [Candidatus Micrarchaeota archaeon CG10_big_fil_rev_8_21_14_0_10_45_29]|nr:MAG: peptide-methionine (S)-S-oxide reductase [Candidatus Micrarchaeota archaeon CG10_big_fil_rev_8_21_14_0_10_45_29]